MSASASTSQGVMANDVARRCERLSDAHDRALVWWLQWASHQPGGLSGVAARLVAENPDASISEDLAKAKPAQMTCRVPPSMEWSLRRDSGAGWDFLSALHNKHCYGETHEEEWPLLGELIADIRKEAVGRLTERLLEICLDQRRELDDESPDFFRGLRSALSRLMAAREAEILPTVVQTEVTAKVWEAFGYALRTRSLVVVNGPARIGKTFSGRAWCEQRPGVARYAQVPSSGDDLSFFRVLARSLGVPFSFSAKVVELRCHIEEVLQRGNLLLCLDEAHYLWPQTSALSVLPKRISWLMTAALNYNVPVVALTTPQFFRHLQRIEDRALWTSHQFTGRIGRFVQLPETVGESDLAAVAVHLVPEIGAKDAKALVALAVSSGRYLAAIDATVKAARDNAELAGRSRVASEDVRRAIAESVLPSDKALASVLARSQAPAHRRRKALASPVPMDCTGDEPPAGTRETSPAGIDLPITRAPQRGGILTEA